MSENKTIIIVDKDLEDLIPGFLANRKKDVGKIRAALNESDFETIKSIGHSLKGVGGGYGFHDVSKLGEAIESSAKSQSAETLSQLANDLEQHLDSIDVQYQ